MAEKMEPPDNRGKKIAFLLPNPCNPDFRVIKHAEAFAHAGYDVRLYCRWAEHLPYGEIINGVTYIREPISANLFLRNLTLHFKERFWFSKPNTEQLLHQARDENKKYLDEFEL